MNEKILRYFDLSSQYGPCIGITRFRRWNRAFRLGLNPPVEILAVLIREELGETGEEKIASGDDKKKRKGDVGEMAYVNDLLATRSES